MSYCKILTIWNNAEFGAELAYIAAKMSDKRILLVDADVISPSIDLILKVRQTPENVVVKGSSFDVIIDAINRKYITTDVIEKASVKHEMKNLFVITGSYDMNNYEFYKSPLLNTFIEKVREGFDMCILLVNRHLYDEYTIYSLVNFDLNIIPTEADYLNLRYFNKCLVHLNERQITMNIQFNDPASAIMSKSKFVAFGYDSKIHLSVASIEEITENNFMGCIAYDIKRITCRNGNQPYVKMMDKKVKEQYTKMLIALGVTSKESFLNKIISKVKGVKTNGNSNRSE